MNKYSDYNKAEYSEIPIIQRDYVQGADRNAEKRDAFLNMLFKSLAGLKDSNGNYYSGQMDFIYGSSVSKSTATGSADSSEQRIGFKPIDGQQRLTTLALIGWLLAQKSKRRDFIMPCLRYRTRYATEQFCNHLMSYQLPENYSDIRTHLISEPIWMAERWLSDPSVNAMLDLLGAADSMLKKDVFSSRIDYMADRFFNDSPLTFELLDMEDYNLTEDLYIKMNARGKHLSEYENWKAEFTGMLETCYKSVKYDFRTVEGVKLTIPEYFSYAIEHEWTDLLWPASLKKWELLDDKLKGESAYPRIDEQFMNILDFVTKALFYSQFPESANYSEFPSAAETLAADWSVRFAGKKKEWLTNRRVDLYRSDAKSHDELNVVTLFKFLDTLCEIDKQFKGNWQQFFSKLLYSGRWDSESRRINIFDGRNDDVNLFGRCLNDTLTMPLEFLLWGMMNYCAKYPQEITTDSLCDFSRTLWGWILSNRQRLVLKKLSVEPDIRVENYTQLSCVIYALLYSVDVYQSLDNLSKLCKDKHSKSEDSTQPLNEQWMDKAYMALKMELQRHSFRSETYAGVIDCLIGCQYLKGDFSNLYSAMSKLEPDVFMARFKEFYNLTEWEKSKALLEYGWKGVRDIVDSKYPFFGKNGHWDYVFTTKEPNFAKAFTSYLCKESYSVPPKHTIEYYIYNYKSFYDAHRNAEDASHLYYAQNDFYVTSLLSTFSCYIPGYQLCPYATVVADIISKNNPEIAQKLNLINSSEKGDHGCLRLNKELYWVESVKEGWRFSFGDSKRWQSKWQQRFVHDENGKWTDLLGKFVFKLDENGFNILVDDDCNNHIDMCVSFLTELYRIIE